MSTVDRADPNSICTGTRVGPRSEVLRIEMSSRSSQALPRGSSVAALTRTARLSVAGAVEPSSTIRTDCGSFASVSRIAVQALSATFQSLAR